MGGQSDNQTVTNKTDIDPVTQAWRSQILGAGNALYSQGYPSYYPGSTVVPFADQTQQGLGMLEQHAGGGAPQYQQAVSAAGRSFQENPAQALAMQTAQGGLQNSAIGALQGFGGANNPHLQGLWDQGSAQVTDAVNANFTRGGRTGSSAHTGALTRELGNLYSNIYAPAYEQERNRGLTAAQTQAQLGEGALNRQVAGQELAGSIWGQQNQDTQRMSALLPSLYEYGGMPARDMMGAGGAWESLASEYLADDQSRYYAPYQGAWQHLNQYASLMNGLPDFSNQNTTSPIQRNRAMGALGGATSGARLGTQIGGSGWGTAIGAIAGGLFGAYG
jgi:hypothetical protein